MKATWKLKFELFEEKQNEVQTKQGHGTPSIIYSSQGTSALFQYEYNLESCAKQGKERSKEECDLECALSVTSQFRQYKHRKCQDVRVHIIPHSYCSETKAISSIHMSNEPWSSFHKRFVTKSNFVFSHSAEVIINTELWTNNTLQSSGVEPRWCNARHKGLEVRNSLRNWEKWYEPLNS